MRGRSGVSLGDIKATSSISRSLFSLAERVAAEEHKKEQEARRAKPQKRTTVGLRVRFSDEQVAEMRRLHQFGGKTCRELAEKYEADRHWMHQVLTYEIRSRYVYG